jgi:hypothetical protein
MPSLAAYPSMMQRDRKREGLRVCRAAWLVGVTVREYREMEAGDRVPEFDGLGPALPALRLAANVRGVGSWMNTRSLRVGSWRCSGSLRLASS